MNILLVDDDEVDRLAVARALRSAGLEATLQEAGSVAAAVTALGASAFDCVLLDYQLPGGDGLDVLRTLKEDDTGTPVIVRMETLRRATLYARKDPQAAKELLTKLYQRLT